MLILPRCLKGENDGTVGKPTKPKVGLVDNVNKGVKKIACASILGC